MDIGTPRGSLSLTGSLYERSNVLDNDTCTGGFDQHRRQPRRRGAEEGGDRADGRCITENPTTGKFPSSGL